MTQDRKDIISTEDHLKMNRNLNRHFEKSLSPDDIKKTIEENFEKGLIDEETKNGALTQLENLIKSEKK